MRKSLTLLALLTSSSALADYDTVIEMRQQAEERRAQQALERMRREHFEINVERKREERREIRREGIREAHREFRRERDRDRDVYDEARDIRENGAMCHDRVTSRGLPSVTSSGAETKALERWNADVRWLHGERFASVENARNATIECSQASTQETVREKVEAAIGAIEKRCSFSALPCRSPIRKMDK